MPLYHSNTDLFEKAVQSAGTVFAQSCFNASGEYNEEVAAELTRLASGFHPVLIFYGEQLAKFSGGLKDQSIVGTLLDMSARWATAVFNSQNEWLQFCSHMAEMVTANNDSLSTLPAATREVLPDRKEAETKMMANQWLVFLLVLRLSEAHLVLLRKRQMKKPAKES